MSVPALTPEQKLRVPVLEHPHWRVNYRPSTYVANKIGTLEECWDVMQKTSVRLRGWDFPHVPAQRSEREYGDTWIAGWNMSHVEYWRFYQSTQFLYLGAVREVTKPEWTSRLRQTMESHAGEGADIESVPGFLSLTNSIYNITEFFELAARLAQAQVYTDPVTIDISVKGIAGFMLAADENKMWSDDYVARQPDLRYEVTLVPAELIGSAAEHAVECAVWLFKRFGWLTPNVDAIRTDQQKLLTRRF